MADEAERWGWRYFGVTGGPDPYLQGPFEGVTIDSGPSIDAQCPHGNDVPSPRCGCGVHYVPDVETLLTSWPRWCASLSSTVTSASFNRPAPPVFALSFGVAPLGRVEVDVKARRPPGIRPSEWPSLRVIRRAARYHMLVLLIPRSQAASQKKLAQRYGCEVLVGDLSLAACRPIEARLKGSLSAAQLAELAAAPLRTAPGDAATAYNHAVARLYRTFPHHAVAKVLQDDVVRRIVANM